MLYFQIQDNVVSGITNKWAMDANRSWECSRDWNTFEEVARVALSATIFSGEAYIPVDNGEWVSPRYDVIKAPAVGDKVSYAFNGDFYPDGEIVKISASGKVITTSSGKKYYRSGLTASWKNSKVWSLVQGHHDERNPHF